MSKARKKSVTSGTRALCAQHSEEREHVCDVTINSRSLSLHDTTINSDAIFYSATPIYPPVNVATKIGAFLQNEEGYRDGNYEKRGHPYILVELLQDNEALEATLEGWGVLPLASLVFHNVPSLYPSSFWRNDFLHSIITRLYPVPLLALASYVPTFSPLLQP